MTKAKTPEALTDMYMQQISKCLRKEAEIHTVDVDFLRALQMRIQSGYQVTIGQAKNLQHIHDEIFGADD